MELTINIQGEDKKIYASYKEKYNKQELLFSNWNVTPNYKEIPIEDSSLVNRYVESIKTIIENNPIKFFEDNAYIIVELN